MLVFVAVLLLVDVGLEVEVFVALELRVPSRDGIKLTVERAVFVAVFVDVAVRVGTISKFNPSNG